MVVATVPSVVVACVALRPAVLVCVDDCHRWWSRPSHSTLPFFLREIVILRREFYSSHSGHCTFVVLGHSVWPGMGKKKAPMLAGQSTLPFTRRLVLGDGRVSAPLMPEKAVKAPYRCELCELGFASLQALRGHELTSVKHLDFFIAVLHT